MRSFPPLSRLVPAPPPGRATSLVRRLALGLFALAFVGLVILVTVRTGLFRQWLPTAGGNGRIASLAVLPLRDLTGDPGQQYFVDGMTEAITASLAQIRSLKVISRTSAVQYDGAKKPLRDIAHELGVDAIVEGSVAAPETGSASPPS